MKPLAAVLVVYNKSIASTSTYQSLQKLEFNGPLLVVDNGLIPQDPPLGCTYLHLAHNPGVSGAYNQALEWARNQQINWLLLLDDDSVLSSDFLRELETSLDTSFNWIAPRVQDAVGWLSPFEFKSGRGNRPTKLKPGKTNHLIPINSGTCLQVNKALATGFDEKLPLDFSDIDFFLRMGPPGLVLQSTIEHALSGASKQPLQQSVQRFVIYCKAAHWFGIKHRNWATMRSQLWKRAILLSWRHKNLVFLWTAWKK